MRVGGIVWNTLKRGGGGTEKRGGETKILKTRLQLGQGMGALKKGPETPLNLPKTDDNDRTHKNYSNIIS